MNTCNVDTTKSTCSEHHKIFQLPKIHLQLEHVSYNQNQSFIKGGTLLRMVQTDEIERLIENFPCVLSTPTRCGPECSKSPLPGTNQFFVSVDVAYFHNKRFLNGFDNRARWCEVGLFRSRRLMDLIDVFKRIQLCRHSMTETFRGKQNYNKQEFRVFPVTMEIMPTFTEANHHEGNATVKKANQTLKSHFNRWA